MINKYGFETEGKTTYQCIKTYASEPEEYGTDFYEGKTYTGEREDEEGYYVDSSENGTSVWLTNEEMTEYFTEVVQ